MMAMMQAEITGLIRRCWDKSVQLGDTPDGGSAAAVLKLAYPGALPFIRSQFDDLEKLKQLAAQDQVLGPIAADAAFPRFAEEFFEELHEVEEGEPPVGAA